MATAREAMPDYQNDEELELSRICNEINAKSIEGLIELKKQYKRIGRGSFGRVYKIPLSDDKFAVVKMISAEFNGKDISEYMETLKDVKHRNIVRHFGYRITEDTSNSSKLLLFMEFVDGVTLRQKMSRTELTVESALSYTDQLVDCLIYMKSKKMIHRDIKPENIMIRTKDACLKLLDFGLVKLVEDTQNWSSLMTHTKVGTPSYRAPEMIDQNSSKVQYNYKVDVWSVGLVFYEMITGKSFSDRTNNQEWSQYVRDIRMDLENTVAGYAQDVKLKCMEFFDKAVHESYKLRAKPDGLQHILNNVYVPVHVLPEISLSFYPHAVTVIQNDLIGYDVQDNGQIVKCDNNQLDGPLIIVSELGYSNKLHVYNVSGTNIGYVKLKDKMEVNCMILYKEDMILISDCCEVQCIRMDRSLVCETTDSFGYISGLCMVTDDIVARCDNGDDKVVFLSVNNNLSAISQVNIDQPLSVCRLSDNEILVGCRDSNYYKITNFREITKLSGFDGLQHDMLSVTDDVMNTVYVLDNYETINRLQINDNSITDCGVVIDISDSKCYRMSYFQHNNKLYIVVADMKNEKLRLYKLN